MRLSPEEPHPAGLAVHYGLGMMGAAYAALRRRAGAAPRSARAGAVPFGLAMFVLQDEGLNTLLGTGAPPGRYPWQTHARGAAAHALFGLVTDSLVRLLPKPRG